MKPINSIELEFDPELFKKGEDLYHNGAILELVKVNTSLFSVIVREGKLYEVELLKPLLKGQKYTCDCSFYKTNKTCRHIVAALLYYQEFSSKIKERKKDKQPPRQKSKIITVKSLLTEINESELKTFVQAYAASDKKFSNALKVNFIRKVDLQDNEKKYKVLLDSVIRPVSSTDYKLKTTELRNFRNIVHDLLEQAHDAIALGDFVEASLIIKTVLSKLHYVVHYFEEAFDEIKDLIKGYYLLFNELINTKKVSVDLKDELKDSLYALVNSSYYHSSLNLFNAIEILKENFKEEHDNLVQWLENKIRQGLSTSKKELAIHYSLIYRIKALNKMDDPFAISKENTPLVEQIIKNVKEADDYNIAILIAKHFIKIYPKEIVYTTILLELYIQTQQEDEFINAVVTSFVKSKDVRLIDLVKRFNLSGVMQKVRDGIRDQMPKSLTNGQKSLLFKKLEDWDGLMAHLYEVKDLRMTMQYDKWLYKEFKEEVTYLYMLLVEQYLDQHLGDFAHVFINELKVHLDRNHMNRISKKIDGLISEKYSHRTKLNDLYS